MAPEEIAEVMVFLASDSARGVNGNIMFVGYLWFCTNQGKFGTIQGRNIPFNLCGWLLEIADLILAYIAEETSSQNCRLVTGLALASVDVVPEASVFGGWSRPGVFL